MLKRSKLKIPNDEQSKHKLSKIFISMKKGFLFIILISAITSNAFTQENKNSLQANVLYGSKIETVGFGLTFNLTGQKHEFSPSANFFLPKSGFKVTEINLDYHRLYGIKDRIKIFPIIGLALSNWNGDYVEDKTTKFGLNLGWVAATILMIDFMQDFNTNIVL